MHAKNTILAVVILTASVTAVGATGHEDKEPRVTSRQKATLVYRTKTEVRKAMGELHYLDSRKIRFKYDNNPSIAEFMASAVVSVRTDDDFFTYDSFWGGFISERQERKLMDHSLVGANQHLRVYPQTGNPRDVFVSYVTHKKISFKAPGLDRQLTDHRWKASAIKAVLGGGVLLAFDSKKNEFAKTQSIQVVNESSADVGFQLKTVWDPNGNSISFYDDRRRSNLEVALERWRDLLGSPQSAKAKPSFLWSLSPGETITLRHGGSPILANHIRAGIKIADGQKTMEFESDFSSNNFVIRLKRDQLPKPVLVKLGDWTVAQDITYKTVRGRSPTTVVTTHGKNNSVSTILEGRDFEYEKEVRAGIATASAPIENPTDRRVRVTIILEFQFTHLLLSNEPVTVELVMAPRSRGVVRASVNTQGFTGGLAGNRKVKGAKTLEIEMVETR